MFYGRNRIKTDPSMKKAFSRKLTKRNQSFSFSFQLNGKREDFVVMSIQKCRGRMVKVRRSLFQHIVP